MHDKIYNAIQIVFVKPNASINYGCPKIFSLTILNMGQWQKVFSANLILPFVIIASTEATDATHILLWNANMKFIQF